MEIHRKKQGMGWENLAGIVKKRSRTALFLLAAVALPAVSSAQDANGRIFGTVYDQQGAVIAAAQIIVTNTATQVVRAAATDNEGHFQVLALPIGNYRVKAEHTGFAR
ncbi:MAG: carboxypeptidase-like regulatory domain-containing protein [Candidatus Sulfotelmatobacter sp.]